MLYRHPNRLNRRVVYFEEKMSIQLFVTGESLTSFFVNKDKTIPSMQFPNNILLQALFHLLQSTSPNPMVGIDVLQGLLRVSNHKWLPIEINHGLLSS